jgi:hypothetical protein
MALGANLLPEDLWYFIGLWFMVMLQPGLNWGFALDFILLVYLCGILALDICWIYALLTLVHKDLDLFMALNCGV